MPGAVHIGLEAWASAGAGGQAQGGGVCHTLLARHAGLGKGAWVRSPHCGLRAVDSLPLQLRADKRGRHQCVGRGLWTEPRVMWRLFFPALMYPADFVLNVVWSAWTGAREP